MELVFVILILTLAVWGFAYSLRHEMQISKIKSEVRELWEVIAAEEDPPKGKLPTEWVQRETERSTRQLPPPARGYPYNRF